MIRAASANLNGWAAGNEHVRAQAFAAGGLDLVCAQELNASRFRALLASLGDGWWGVHSLTARKGLPATGSFWGVAVFVRTEAVVPDGAADVIGNPEDDSDTGLFWRRTIVAPIRTTVGAQCTVASIHVRPGAVVGEQKLQFLGRLGGWLSTAPRPLVLGVDTNSAGFYETNPKFWGTEDQVWGPQATHGLTDTWVRRGHGFSATHHLRNNTARFDQIWTSDNILVQAAEHHLSLAEDYGSDHALVTADLDWS